MDFEMNNKMYNVGTIRTCTVVSDYYDKKYATLKIIGKAFLVAWCITVLLLALDTFFTVNQTMKLGYRENLKELQAINFKN